MADERLTFDIEVNSNGEAVIKNLRREVDETGSAIEKSTKKAAGGVDILIEKAKGAAGAIAAMVGVGSLGAIALLAKQSLSAADALTDLADQSGLSVGKLLALEQVTTKYGVSVQEAATGVRFMLRSLVEAQSGTNSQSDAMKRLGFSTRDTLRYMSDPDGFLDAFAKKLAGLPTHAERLAAAQDLASRAGGRLAPILLDMAQNGLPRVSAETERAYKVIGEWADFLAVQAVKKIQLFNTVVVDIAKSLSLIPRTAEDNLAALDRQIGNLQEKLAKPTTIFNQRDRLTDEIKLNGLLRDRLDLAEQIARTQASTAPEVAQQLVDTKKIESVTEALKKQITALEGQRISLEQGALAGLRFSLVQEALLQLNTNKLPQSISSLIDKLIAQAGALEKAKFEQDKLDEVTRRTDQDIAEFVNGLKEIAQIPIKDALEQDRLVVEAFAQSVGAAFDTLDAEEGERLKATRTASDSVGQAILDARDRLKEIDSLGGVLGSSFDTVEAKISAARQAIEQLNRLRLDPAINDDAFKRATDAIENFKAVLKDAEFQRLIENVFDSIGTGIENTIRGIEQGTQTLAEGLKGLARNVLLEINNFVLRTMVIDPLKKYFKELAGNLLGTIGVSVPGAQTVPAAGGAGSNAAQLAAIQATQTAATAAIQTTGVTAQTGLQTEATVGQSAITATQTAATTAIQAADITAQTGLQTQATAGQIAITATQTTATTSIEAVKEVAIAAIQAAAARPGGGGGNPFAPFGGGLFGGESDYLSGALGTGLFSGVDLFEFGHSGGVIGSTRFPTRLADPRMFIDAPRYATGGMVGAKNFSPLQPGEVPIIAHRGERILNPEETKQYNSGRGVTKSVNVTMNLNGVRDAQSFQRSQRSILKDMQRAIERTRD